MPDAHATLSARELGRAALEEMTPLSTIGAPAGEVDEGDGTVSYLFEVVMPGYPGWKWAATMVQLEGEAPTVLETHLVPGDGSLLAPDWTPWSERMDDYRAAQLALGEAEAADDDDDDDSDDDDDDDDDDSDDDDDDDDFGSDFSANDFSPLLHSGDLDGVDIDEIDLPEADGGAGEPVEPQAEPQPVRRARSRRASSAVTTVGVDEADHAEPEAGGAGEKPPRVARSGQRARKQQQDD